MKLALLLANSGVQAKLGIKSHPQGCCTTQEIVSGFSRCLSKGAGTARCWAPQNSRVPWRQQASLGAGPAHRPRGRRAVPEPLSCPVAVGQVEELKCPNLVLSPSLIFLSWCFLPHPPSFLSLNGAIILFFSGGTKDLCLSSCSLDLLLIHVVSCLLL